MPAAQGIETAQVHRGRHPWFGTGQCHPVVGPTMTRCRAVRMPTCVQAEVDSLYPLMLLSEAIGKYAQAAGIIRALEPRGTCIHKENKWG
jgi:hypothetical protein